MKPIEGLVISNFLVPRPGGLAAPVDNYDRLTSNTLRRALAAYEADESVLAFVLVTDSNISGAQANRILRRWQDMRGRRLVQAER